MRFRVPAMLVMSLLLIICFTACEQPSKNDEPAAKADTASGAQPTWTAGWGQIKRGLDSRDVLALLGDPKHMTVTGVNTIWYYSDQKDKGPRVVFDTGTMRVDRWQPPASE